MYCVGLVTVKPNHQYWGVRYRLMSHHAVSSCWYWLKFVGLAGLTCLCVYKHGYLLIPSNRVKGLAPQGKLPIFGDCHKVHRSIAAIWLTEGVGLGNSGLL